MGRNLMSPQHESLNNTQIYDDPKYPRSQMDENVIKPHHSQQQENKLHQSRSRASKPSYHKCHRRHYAKLCPRHQSANSSSISATRERQSPLHTTAQQHHNGGVTAYPPKATRSLSPDGSGKLKCQQQVYANHEQHHHSNLR